MAEASGAAQLEQDLEALLQIESFPPPASFAEHARIHDSSIHEAAAADPVGWWSEQARALDWFEEPTTALDDSNAPFYTWFKGGTLNASYNCVDRHIDAGLGDRVAFHWHGEEGEQRAITYADLPPRRPAGRQRAEGSWRRQGRRRRDLPADDPRGRRRHARVCPHRGAAQRRLRRLLRRVGARTHGGLPRQGADHRRSRPPQGQDRAGQVHGRRGHGRPRDAGVHLRGPQHRRGLSDGRRPRRLLGRRAGRRRPGVPGRAPGRRAPAVHPVLLGLDRKAQGHPAHHRRLPDRGRLDAQARLRPATAGGRVLVLGRRRLDHRALLHRLRAADERHDVGDVRRRAGLPAPGHLVGAVREVRRHAVLHRADGHPRLHEVGVRQTRRARPLEAAASGLGR